MRLNWKVHKQQAKHTIKVCFAFLMCWQEKGLAQIEKTESASPFFSLRHLIFEAKSSELWRRENACLNRGLPFFLQHVCLTTNIFVAERKG